MGSGYGTWSAYGSGIDPEACALSQATFMGSLVGSLDGGASWFRLADFPITIMGPGTLLLSANDCPGAFADNTGAVNATIDVAPAPIAPVITGPAANTSIDTSFTLTGTAQPSTFLQIKATTTGGGVTTTSTTAAPDGTWSASVNSPTPPIASGFDVQVTEFLPIGVNLLSNMLHLTNYITVAPTITSPANGAVVGQTFPMSGTGIPQAQIRVSKSTSGGAFSIQGTAIVDANGAWNFTFVSATPLPVDGLDLRATQHMRPDGFPTPDSPPSNVVHVAPPVVQCLPGTYSATGNAPCTTASAGYYVATAGATAQVACPVGMTSAAGAVACTPLPAPPAPVFYKPAQNEPVNGLYQVDGGSLNGASVTLTVSVAGNVVETHVFPNTPGGWAMTGLFSPLPISAQGFDLTAVQTVPGNPTPSAPAVVHVTNVMPPPVITSPVNGQVVGEFLFVVRGTGVPHAEVAVSVPGRPSQFPVPVDFDGTWAVSFASAPNNPPGGFDISVAQRPWFPTTVAPWGDQVSVHVTNWAPEPVIVSPVAESTIPGATFQVTGTGVPGDMINVLVNFVTLGINPVVAPDGTWSATVPVPPYSPDGFSLNARQWSPVPDSQGAFSPPIHLMGTAPPPCAPGSFSATGFVPCTPAPAGSYVSAAGATSATPWTVCTPNQYVVTAGTASSDVVCAAKLATTTTVTFGAGPFPAKGSAYTATASVSPTAAGSAAIVYSGDCVNPGTTCKATATFPGSATYASSAASASITIVAVTSGQYRVCTVRGDHDNDEDDDRGGSRARGHESGSTLPVQVRICDANGRNVGSRTLVVKAVGLSPSGVLSDAGKSNPGNLFRFDDGVYTFNLSTKGLAGGTYTLDFTVGSDPTVNHYSFTVRPEKVVPNGGKGDGKGDDKGGH